MIWAVNMGKPNHASPHTICQAFQSQNADIHTALHQDEDAQRRLQPLMLSHGSLKWLGNLARMPDKRLPKRVLFGYKDGSEVRGMLAGGRSNGWIMSGKTCNSQGFHLYG